MSTQHFTWVLFVLYTLIPKHHNLWLITLIMNWNDYVYQAEAQGLTMQLGVNRTGDDVSASASNACLRATPTANLLSTPPHQYPYAFLFPFAVWSAFTHHASQYPTTPAWAGEYESTGQITAHPATAQSQHAAESTAGVSSVSVLDNHQQLSARESRAHEGVDAVAEHYAEVSTGEDRCCA
jgi:hypothetical protein